MSQLVVKPGRNVARQARRNKDIRKVEGAIIWHARERKKRQKVAQERWDSKQALLQHAKWKKDNIDNVKRKALQNVREDWQLGPLRPNRAIGEGADKYGALTGRQLQKPEIPVHMHRDRNEARRKWGLELEYPLIVDSKKYFHIEKDDRVVVVNGREKGKIGLVQDIVARTHEIIVTGVNKQYYDSDVFNNGGEDVGPKRANEVPIPMNDVRLVVPYEMTEILRLFDKATGNVEETLTKVCKDVIVDKVFMERHTTGIDPFTGKDYGDAEIPKDHQYDPRTSLPIFHRYIAGTQHRIEWPWEKPKVVEDTGLIEEDTPDRPGFLSRTWSTVRHPINSLKSMTSKKPENKAPKAADGEAMFTAKRLEDAKQQASIKKLPKSKDPGLAAAYDDIDTTRNIVEDADSMAYTLVAPPFPDTLGAELRDDIASFERAALEDKDSPRPLKFKRRSRMGDLMGGIARAKLLAAQKMKTPMQLRWEMEQARKIKKKETEPLVSTSELLEALNRHRAAQKVVKGPVEKVEGVE
ncbi:hypothetical protein CC86DRAFT_339661 [Ophiobolus disseminans]|uniref:KOW domain-containing protein n=1 Tax=Ophiobolus disseminans TaxID=1469910 RepID=A0A6A7AL31_9PLEO|nr:hypothetical protein CC86DRAFT_339661 [Ophiobolus disseminans]